MLYDLARDLRFAFRLLLQSPAFTLVAITSLSLGIGANTAIFSLMNAVIFRSLAVPHPERVVQISSVDSRGHFTLLSYAQLSELRRRQTSFSSVSGWLLPVINVEVNQTPSRSVVLVATEDYYSTFPVQIILGRALSHADWHSATGGIANVAVISEECWQSRFGRDPGVLGKKVRVEAHPFSIVGVASREFSSPQIDVTAEIAIPVEAPALSALSGKPNFDPNSTFLFVSARLRDGFSLNRAASQCVALWPSILKQTVPHDLNPAQASEFLTHRLRVEPGSRGQSFLRNRFTDTLQILMAAVGTLLLLACVNLSTLLLARADARTGELNLRLALGAVAGRLLRQLFTESLLLGATSAGVGILLAFWFTHLMLPWMWASPVPLTISVTPDVRGLAFTIALALAATVLFGLAPGWMTIRETLQSGLRQAARTVVGKQGSRLRQLLVISQVALALALLVGAGLLMRTADALRNVNLGFQPRHVAILFINPNPGGYGNADMVAYDRELLREISLRPGVTSASLSNWLPVHESGWTERVSAGSPVSFDADTSAVSYDYFKTLGTPILAGREFSPADLPGSRRVVIISESLAKRLFPAADAVGRTISVGQEARHRNLQIIGVAQNARFGDLHRHDPPIVYLPVFQEPATLLQFPVLEVRAVGDPLGVVPSVTGTIRALNREYCFWAESLGRSIDINLGEERMLATLSTFFGVVSLFIALIGLYGLLAFIVNRRIREFGVRMALGAGRGRIFQSVFVEAMLLLVCGVAAGIPLALGGAKLLSSRLSSLNPRDPFSFTIAIAALLAVGLLAAVIPARSAAVTDPAQALRAE